MPRSNAKKTEKPTGSPTGIPKSADFWDQFFEAVATSGGNVTRACERCKVTRMAIWQRENTDPAFKERLVLAKKIGADVLEEEATRRAFEGVEEPVGFFQGVSTEVRTNYSDALIQFLLKGLKPEKFRERTENVNTNFNVDLAGRLEAAKKRREGGGK